MGMSEHLHNDELRQRLANAEKERDAALARIRGLASQKAGLAYRLTAAQAKITELDQMLADRLGAYLELKAIVDLREELGQPPAPEPEHVGRILVDCDGTLSVAQTAGALNIDPTELQALFDETGYPVMCPRHGSRVPPGELPAVKDAFDDRTAALFRMQLDEL